MDAPCVLASLSPITLTQRVVDVLGAPAVPDPVELLRDLLRFDTTNPPGAERECVEHVRQVLSAADVESELYARDPERPNLIARLSGTDGGSPLLLYGHVDVVPTAGQQWTHPPFAGQLVDGVVWGRGALDMKTGVAMMITAFLRVKAEGAVPPGGLVLAVLSDEEAGGDFGAKFLAREHPEALAGIRHAIGEVGGVSIHIAGRRFYPIQVAEKRMCHIKATVRGPGGHAARPTRGGAMARLGTMLRALDRKRTPPHVTVTARAMIEAMADALPRPKAAVLRGLLDTRTHSAALRLIGEQGRPLEGALRNTVNATIVRGGSAVNVIPSEIEVELDGRLLPGFGPDDLLAELRAIIGADIELEVLRHDEGPSDPDMACFDELAAVIRELDPEGVPVPMLLPAVTDARHLSPLGIQTYGFIPMRLPEDFPLATLAHAADERVPAEAAPFGAEAIFRAIQRYRG
jgi:acetylornithine deacetylase/succinyl-diaminopimelate desuccinylase-like protein